MIPARADGEGRKTRPGAGGTGGERGAEGEMGKPVLGGGGGWTINLTRSRGQGRDGEAEAPDVLIITG